MLDFEVSDYPPAQAPMRQATNDQVNPIVVIVRFRKTYTRSNSPHFVVYRCERCSHRSFQPCAILADKNFQAPAIAEEVEAQVAKIKAVIEQYRRTASLGGITIGQGGQYTIPVPADGTIIEVRAVVGNTCCNGCPVAASQAPWCARDIAGALPFAPSGAGSIRQR